MENGPAQAEIVYFALYKLAQFPGEITEGEEYKTGLSFQPVLRIRADFFRIRIQIRGSGFKISDPDPYGHPFFILK